MCNLIMNLNAQSLVAHAHNIAMDAVLTQFDYVAITEPWMDPENPVHLDGFELNS